MPERLSSTVPPTPRHERPLLEGASITVADYHCSGRDGDADIKERTQGHELCFVRCGMFGVATRGERYVADANSIVLLRTGQEYATRHPEGDADICTVFSLRPGTMASMLRDEDDAHAAESVPWTVRAADSSWFREHWKLLFELAGDAGDPDRPLAIEERALGLAAGVLRAPEPAPRVDRPARAATRRAHQEVAEAIKERLSVDLSSKVTLDDLATEFGWSPFELTRIFRGHTGSPIHRYRRQLRLRTAVWHLADGEASIARLAHELGFATHSHLSAAFRDEFGVTPAELRELASEPLRQLVHDAAGDE
jgi:AraC family transcriptional regulator